MPPQRNEGPRRLGDYIRLFLKKNGLAGAAGKVNLRDAFEAAVGDPRLSSHSRPGTVRSGILKVLVDSSVVLQELKFRRKDIVEKIQKSNPEAHVRDIRFVVGNPRSPQ